MKDVKGVSFKLDDSEVEPIEAIYPSLNFAATRIIKALIYLRRESLNEIRGKIEGNEIKYIIDLVNTLIFQPRMAVVQEMIIHEIEDGNRYEELGEKWKVDVGKFVEKIRSLTSAQVYFLVEFCKLFWEKDHGQTDIDEYVQQLLLE